MASRQFCNYYGKIKLQKWKKRKRSDYILSQIILLHRPRYLALILFIAVTTELENTLCSAKNKGYMF